MKKFVVSLLISLMAVMGMKATITATFEYTPGTYYPAVIPLPLYDNGVRLILFGSMGPKITIRDTSSLTSDVGPITEIVFEQAGSSAFTFSSGTYHNEGYNLVWVGNESEVTFTPNTSGSAKRIVVTVDDSGQGSDPEFGIGDLFNMSSGDEFISAFPATVLWQSSKYLYIKDPTGFGLIYGDVGHVYKQGDEIPPGWGGKVGYYNGFPELMPPFFGFDDPIFNETVNPEEISFAQLDRAHWAHYVMVREVTIDPIRHVLVDKYGNELPYYNQFQITLPNDLTRTYTFYGIVGVYQPSSGQPIFQLLITDYDPKDPINEVDCLEDLYLLPQGEVTHFKSPLVVISQASSTYLYVKDQRGRYGLIYGSQVGGPFMNGDSIIGDASWSTYQQIPQLKPDGEWEVVGHGPLQQPKRIDAIEDVETDWAHMYVQFSGVSVYHDNESLSYIMSDETDEMALFNHFNITIPTFRYPDVAPTYDDEPTISTVMNLINYILTGGPAQSDGTAQHPWKNCYVAGFLGVFEGNLELYPTVVNTEAIHNYDINGDGEINIADVNALINNIINY